MKIQLLSEGARVPERATGGAVAYDLFLPSEVKIMPGRQIVPLDIAIELPVGIEAKIEARSGFASKGMEDIDGVRRDADALSGKIDYDYRGNICLIVNSHEKEPFTLAKGIRCAQMTFYRVELLDMDVVDELRKTDRGVGGFGHTGIL